tara:strand:- start:49 stop:549 length:501 start_codon:yes stop_codon:yes gene_type:complete
MSSDIMEIHAQKILSKLKKMKSFSEAKSIGCYYSIGSEVKTNNIIKLLLEREKIVSLPKVTDDTMIFRKIEDVAKLEKGNFDISEPKETCPIEENHDVILVPSIGLDDKGNRIGYGYGFYDNYLTKNDSIKIALTYSKQIVKSIPTSEYDVKMDWIVSETDIIKIS